MCICTVCITVLNQLLMSSVYFSLTNYAETHHEIPESVIWSWLVDLLMVSRNETELWSRDYKTFPMLNSAEHEIAECFTLHSVSGVLTC